MARLSIIIPVLDEAEGIAATLGGLASFRECGAEVIVVDGGSRDDTVALAAPLADRVIAAPRGRASQMNAGAAAAGGDVLMFLHADTQLPPHADQLVLGGLASHWTWGRFDVRIDSRNPMLAVVAGAMNWRSQITGIATGDQAIFVSRETFAAVGGFPDIPLMEDIAICRRLKRAGKPLCLAARVTTSARRWQRGGVLRTILLMWRLRLLYFLGTDPAELVRRYEMQD